jgi:hypothetical protein
METDLSKNYSVLTLEFENMYRTADDLFRKTKQTVEIYAATAGVIDAIAAVLEGENAIAIQVDKTKE